MNNITEWSQGIDPDNGLEKFVIVPSFNADASEGMGNWHYLFEWRNKQGEMVFQKNDKEAHGFGLVQGNKRISNGMQKYDDEGKELVNMEDYISNEPVLDKDGKETYTKRVVTVKQKVMVEGEPVLDAEGEYTYAVVDVEVDDKVITEPITKQREVSKQTVDKFDQLASAIVPIIKPLIDPILQKIFPKFED